MYIFGDRPPNLLKIRSLMLLRKLISVYYENHETQNTVCSKMRDFLMLQQLPLGFKRLTKSRKACSTRIMRPRTSQCLTAQRGVRCQACGIFVNKVKLGHVILRILRSSRHLKFTNISCWPHYFVYHRRL
jgi:hypothetical protein